MANEYLPFAFMSGANVMPQTSWLGHGNRQTGFTTGVADAAAANKIWRQCSVMTAAIGEFISTRIAPQDVVDDGDVAVLTTQFETAIETLVSTAAGMDDGVY